MATIIAATGFWAQLDTRQAGLPVLRAGYSPGIKIYSPAWLPIVQPNPALMLDPPAGPGNNALEAFLNTLYGAGANLISDERRFHLSDEMEAAGELDQFDKLQVVDFMALTEAVERHQVMPDGTQVDLLSFQPGQQRPGLQGLQKKDSSVMLKVIRHLGLQGFCPHLWARGGITFQEFSACLKEWKPDLQARQQYVAGPLNTLLRQKLRARMFRPEELQSLFT